MKFVCRQDPAGKFVPTQAIPDPGEPFYDTLAECQVVCDIFNLKEAEGR